MEGTLENALWWQILKIALFMGGAVFAIRYVRRWLFPDKGPPKPPEPPRAWQNGRPVTPEILTAGQRVMRDDGLWFVYLRKAEPDEFREGIEEWLFHPPGQEREFWVGLTRDEFVDLRLVDIDADPPSGEPAP